MEVDPISERSALQHSIIYYPLTIYLRDTLSIINWASNAVWAFEQYEGDRDELFGRWFEAEDVSDHEKQAIRWVLIEKRSGTEISDLREQVDHMRDAVMEIYPRPAEWSC